MVTHLSQIPGSDECYFRTFCFAIPSAKTEEKMKRLRTVRLDTGPALSREERITRLVMQKVQDALGNDTPPSSTDGIDRVTQTRPGRTAPIPDADGMAEFVGEPQPDAYGKDGGYCTLCSLNRASGMKLDHGRAGLLARSGQVKPDAVFGGRAAWRVGSSARTAMRQFQSLAPAPSK
jgi:hypothetical protein